MRRKKRKDREEKINEKKGKEKQDARSKAIIEEKDLTKEREIKEKERNRKKINWLQESKKKGNLPPVLNILNSMKRQICKKETSIIVNLSQNRCFKDREKDFSPQYL